MTKRKYNTPKFQAIDDRVLGEYSVSDYSERLYSKVYYSIRSLCGLLAKNSFQDFNWDVFKERFASDFGKVEEKRYSLEQLLEFAFRKFGKTFIRFSRTQRIILAAQKRICCTSECKR
jgi:hypothetical protein